MENIPLFLFLIFKKIIYGSLWNFPMENDHHV